MIKGKTYNMVEEVLRSLTGVKVHTQVGMEFKREHISEMEKEKEDERGQISDSRVLCECS